MRCAVLGQERMVDPRFRTQGSCSEISAFKQPGSRHTDTNHGVRGVNRCAVRRWISHATFFLSVAFLCGCRSSVCEVQFTPILASSTLSKGLAEWADESIFSRVFDESELVAGRLAGPGSFAAPMNKLAIEFPIAILGGRMPDNEVRLLYSKERTLVAVFIGQSSYNGILVAKDSVESASRALGVVDGAAFDRVNGRVAMSCGN